MAAPGADAVRTDTGEVDEAALRVGSEQLYPYLIPDVEPLVPLLDKALDGRVEDAHPRPSSERQPMSEDESSPYSAPTSAGGLFIRVVFAVLVIGGIVGIIWYLN